MLFLVVTVSVRAQEIRFDRARLQPCRKEPFIFRHPSGLQPAKNDKAQGLLRQTCCPMPLID
jgi:hypothetical protein